MLLHIINYICLKSMLKHIIMMTLANFVKEKRNEVKLTQEAFAERAGVALTVIRKLNRERKTSTSKK